MDDETHERPVSTAWGRADGWPTAKQRTGVEHAVRRLLDTLAPERTPPRHGEPRDGLQRHRTPRGCILQNDAGAVSVSWFPAATTDDLYGELQVIAWAGVVSRPGATRRAAGGARPLAEALFRPVETPADQWSWRAADGTLLDGGALAARCLDLLARDAPPDVARA
jgi:hypothetical protein